MENILSSIAEKAQVLATILYGESTHGTISMSHAKPMGRSLKDTDTGTTLGVGIAG